MITHRAALLGMVAFGCLVATPATAERQIAVGPGNIPLSVIGGLNGVDLQGSATTGTLIVGVVGGPATDIFSSNTALLPGSVAISTAASSQGNITFNSSSTVFGAIGVTQPGGPFVLAIAGGNTGTTVNFMGPVFATTINETGTGRINFNSGTTNIAATNFAADGTISLAPRSTLIGALTTTAGANTGTLVLGSGSRLDGAVGGAVGLKAINVVGGSDAAGISASISGAVDAFSFGLGTNTLNIGGALTIANIGTSGVINTTLASPTVFGNIRPLGTTNLGPSLLLNVTVSPTAYIPVGSQFNIIQTASGTAQSGTNGSILSVKVQSPTNPLYTFKAVPASGTIAGQVTIVATGIPLQAPLAPPVGVVLPPITPVAVVIVPVLIAATPTPDLVNVLAPINALTDPAAVVLAVAQLAPSSTDGAAPIVTFDASRQLQNLWTTRLANVACDQVDPAKESEKTPVCKQPRGGLWMQGFGFFSRQDGQQAIAGYDASVGGAMIAFDAPLGDSTHAGAGFGYTHSTIRARGSSTRTAVDGYQVTVYVGHNTPTWFLNAAVSASANDYSGSRDIMFPGVTRQAVARYNGQAYTAFASTGLHINRGALTVTPLASIQATRVILDGYSETGAGDINLRVAARTYDFVESALGVKIAQVVETGRGAFIPEVHAKWLHAISNPDLDRVAAFTLPGSQNFTVPGLRPADNTLNAGASVTLASCACTTGAWSFEAGYDYYRTNNGGSANQGTVRLTTRF